MLIYIYIGASDSGALGVFLQADLGHFLDCFFDRFRAPGGYPKGHPKSSKKLKKCSQAVFVPRLPGIFVFLSFFVVLGRAQASKIVFSLQREHDFPRFEVFGLGMVFGFKTMNGTGKGMNSLIGKSDYFLIRWFIPICCFTKISQSHLRKTRFFRSFLLSLFF